MRIHKAVICLFKGHVVDPEETIIPEMFDKRNWLCECHRCGLYVMHDGAISRGTITITKKMAEETKRDFERDMMEFRRRMDHAEEDI